MFKLVRLLGYTLLKNAKKPFRRILIQKKMTSKFNKFFERISQCMQVNTSNSAMLENGLDYSGGNSTPQFKFDSEDVENFKEPLRVFADNDLMYNDKVTVNDTEVNEYNSTENAANNIPLLSE